MKRINFIFLMIFLMIVYLISFLCGYQLIISLKNNQLSTQPVKKSGNIWPLKQFDYSNNYWKLYLVVRDTDKKELKKWNKYRGNCFVISDSTILEQLSNDWKFKITNGDVATVSSYIVLYKNGRRQFESGIVLENGVQGLQNKDMGWIEPQNKMVIDKYLRSFKPTYYPVLILN